jgi:hypothetical protein
MNVPDMPNYVETIGSEKEFIAAIQGNEVYSIGYDSDDETYSWIKYIVR